MTTLLALKLVDEWSGNGSESNDGKEARCRGARHIEVQIQGVLMNIEALVD